MITREELRRIPRLHRQIERDKEQLKYLREKATAIASPLGRETEKVQQTPKNLAGRYTEAAADLSREIAADEQELAELKRKAEEIILPMRDGISKRIMRYRYLGGYSWEEVADMIGYAERHCRQIEADIANRLAL